MDTFDRIHSAIHERITNPNAFYYAVPWWEKEIEALTIDIMASIRFSQQECTDEEIWRLGEIAEDLAEKTQSRELLQSMQSLAELIQDTCPSMISTRWTTWKHGWITSPARPAA